MTERRRFSASERVALYLAADGRCTNCRKPLEAGWHADHMHPFTAGGPTDVVNGQALCPNCNLTKGAKLFSLRPWQEEALMRFLSSHDDFLTVACPGAGKTAFAVNAAMRMIDRDEIERVVVVVPTAHLRGQWARAASRFGLQIDPDFANRQTVLANDFDGVAVTYASVASEAQLWRKLTSDRRTLVILDEIHHGGHHDDLTWGPAAVTAFAPAVRRLLLSGTPSRSDGHPVPFVTYDNGLARVGFSYDYGRALQDGGVVRPAAFPVRDGEASWTYAGRISQSVLLSDSTDDDLPKALRAIYAPDGEWIPSVLREADDDLAAVREEMPDAAAMVNACDQEHARAYVDILRQITGITPAIATSDDPRATDIIRRFERSNDRWIVTVNMVSEGVDIPRLVVGVYASRSRTQMAFVQWVGRFVRWRGSDDATTARLYIPAVDSLVDHARSIEQTVMRALVAREQEEDNRAARQLTLNITDPLMYTSGEPTDLGSVHRGTEFGAAELAHAKTLGEQAGLRDAPEAIARLLRIAGHEPVVAQVPISVPPAPTPTLAEQKEKLRSIVNGMVSRYARETGEMHKDIHRYLNRRCGEGTIRQATIESLNQRIEILRERLT